MDVDNETIPLLNELSANGDVVRFRGMIQDMHNPEFYFETYEIFDKTTKLSRLASGKYRDTGDVGPNESVDYNSPKLKSAERVTVTVVSPPGLNEWARTLESPRPERASVQNHPNSKRPSQDEDDEDMPEAETNPPKRKPARESQESTPSTRPPISADTILNLPLPDRAAKVCSVKVYDDFDSLKLNEVIEITGHLSLDPATSELWNSPKDRDSADTETLLHNPPPSLIPRIHATRIVKLSHFNPLIDSKFDKENYMKEAVEAREHLHTVLTQVLFGDQLAADYLICHLISHVYIRRDVLTLGKFSLNLWKMPQSKDYTEQLYDIIRKIVTKSHYLPVTVNNLNTLNFAPKKDYEADRLLSGILQLSDNTHLILDETKMEPGQLNNSGVLNVASLNNVIENQKVKYNFKFYEMDYNCDIPVLILSEGKSLFSSDFSIPILVDESMLKISKETFEAANFYLNEAVSNKIRIYLTALRLVNYHISDEPKYVQEDFISMRKENIYGRETKEEDLHDLLVLTRLLCLSKGFNTINQECWNGAKEMERQRHIRLNEMR